MYKWLLCALVLLAGVSVTLADETEKKNPSITKTSDPDLDAQVVVVATPPPVSKGQIVFMVITSCLLAVMVAQVVFLRSDLERFMAGKK
jgi:hypothetical protein